jgi:hypothetical protein
MMMFDDFHYNVAYFSRAFVRKEFEFGAEYRFLYS